MAKAIPRSGSGIAFVSIYPIGRTQSGRFAMTPVIPFTSSKKKIKRREHWRQFKEQVAELHPAILESLCFRWPDTVRKICHDPSDPVHMIQKEN
jgi:hypothetical protein